MSTSSTANATRPRRKDAQRNGELVLQAAREVLAEFGINAGMEQIAGRAGVGVGVGVGTVYRRFPNKEALIDELVRIILLELVASAREELSRDDGAGLERFLRILGRSFAEQRGYVEKLVGHTRSDCGQVVLRELIGELLGQAHRHAQIGPGIGLGDVLASIWGLRGVIATTGAVAPDAWERYLDIQLAGFRAPGAPSQRTGICPEQLSRITGGPKTEV